MSNSRLINNYESPTVADLQKLKESLGKNGTQMADLVGVSSNSVWRRYTGGAEPRAMSAHMLFFAAAQLVLNPDELDKVIKKMTEIGAKVD